MINDIISISFTRKINIIICQNVEKSVANESRGENQVNVVETADLDGRVAHRRREQRRGTSRRIR